MAISHSDIQALNFFNLFEKFGENVGGKEQDKKCWRWIEKMSLVLHRKGWSVIDYMQFKKHMMRICVIWEKWKAVWFDKLGRDALRR